MTDAATPVAANKPRPARTPREPASVVPRPGLPAKYAPKIAGYARGPFLEPETVTPSEWKWRNARTFTVRSGGQDWRAIRVHSAGEFIGYWAIELLGIPLVGPEGME